MRWICLLATVILASSALAQEARSLPASLPQLAAILPALINAKEFQPGPYSDAVDAALRKNPSSGAPAAEICARNLRDSNPQVRVWTLATLHAIAVTPEGPSALQSADDQIAQILIDGDETSRRGAMLITLDLRQNTPDSFISPLEQLMQSPSASERIRAGAGSALAMARPTDPDIQSAIVNVINDPRISINLRSLMIDSTASPFVGSIVSDNVVRLGNTATDKIMRDAAISAATKIGPAAVTRIRDRITAILKDPSESDHSRLIASMALQRLP